MTEWLTLLTEDFMIVCLYTCAPLWHKIYLDFINLFCFVHRTILLRYVWICSYACCD